MLSNLTDNEPSLQEQLQRLQSEKNELESDFGQKRAMFMELFKQKEGTCVHSVGPFLLTFSSSFCAWQVLIFFRSDFCFEYVCRGIENFGECVFVGVFFFFFQKQTKLTEIIPGCYLAMGLLSTDHALSFLPSLFLLFCWFS